MAIHWGGSSGGGGGGTVTSVGGTGTVNGITLTGTVTSAGSLTLGGTLSGVSLTTQVSGTLPTASGGTNLTSFTSGGAVYATSASALTTGTLPIASGGTSATTKAAAFNALSPVTTTGDLIIGNGSNSNTRLAIGASGRYLVSNGSTASWQPLSVSASSISGTVEYYQGGTGVSSAPSSGQLLIGTSISSYQLATLTAGSGIIITNGSGSITIAAGTVPYIDVINLNFGSQQNTSGFTPLVYQGASPNPTDVFSFYFFNNTTGYSFNPLSLPGVITITDSAAVTTTYNGGTDYSAYGTYSGYASGQVVSTYGIQISNPAMLATFAATAALYTDPTIRPGNVTASSPDNAFIGVTTPGPAYSNNYTGQYLGCYVKKVGSVYTVYFGTGDLSYYTTAFPNDLYINPVGPIGGTTFVGGGGDFTSSLFVNESNGYAYIELSSVLNPTLQAWLDASIQP